MNALAGSEYVICIYIRISVEDSDVGVFKDESGSITSQRRMLYDYIQGDKELCGCKVIERCDDGFSGTDFKKRPAFTDMIDLVKKGKIQCIIVKDLSRLGRDYIEIGDYLEQFFPFFNIRVISVNDNYDSGKLADGEIGGLDVVFKNIVYDFYARENSKKRKQTWRRVAEKGLNMSTFPSYGYRKSKTEKGKLVIDPMAAPIVREIFEMRLSGMELSQITRNLNDRKIPCPTEQRVLNGEQRKHRVQELYWSGSAVYEILCNEKYTGSMINLKTYIKGTGGKQCKLPREQWVIVKNTHEAIVDYDTFYKVQAMFRKSEQKKNRNKRNIYYCGVCGCMLLRNQHDWIGCRSRSYINNSPCKDVISNGKQTDYIVLEAIKKNVRIALDHLQYRKELQKDSGNTLEMELKNKESRVSSEKQTLIAMYDQYAEGILSRDSYLERKKIYDENVKVLQEEIAGIKLELQKLSENGEDIEGNLREVLEETELTEAIKDTFIERVNVYGRNQIEIIWKCADIFGEYGEE